MRPDGYSIIITTLRKQSQRYSSSQFFQIKINNDKIIRILFMKIDAGKIICISFEQKHISVKQKRKERATLHNPLFVCKFCVLSEPYQLDASGRTISLFGYNNFRQILFLCIRIIIFISVQEHNNVGILLDCS